MERGFVKILEHTNTIVPKRSIRASRFNDVSMVNAAPWHSWNALTKQSQHWNSPKKQSQHCYLVCLVATLYDYVGGRITRRLGLETLLSKKENKNMVHTPREMKSTKVNPQRTRTMCVYVCVSEEENIASQYTSMTLGTMPILILIILLLISHLVDWENVDEWRRGRRVEKCLPMRFQPPTFSYLDKCVLWEGCRW